MRSFVKFDALTPKKHMVSLHQLIFLTATLREGGFIPIQDLKEGVLPSGNQTWQWKKPPFIDDFPWKPPFFRDFQLPCWITKRYRVPPKKQSQKTGANPPGFAGLTSQRSRQLRCSATPGRGLEVVDNPG